MTVRCATTRRTMSDRVGVRELLQNLSKDLDEMATAGYSMKPNARRVASL